MGAGFLMNEKEMCVSGTFCPSEEALLLRETILTWLQTSCHNHSSSTLCTFGAVATFLKLLLMDQSYGKKLLYEPRKLQPSNSLPRNERCFHGQ